MSNARVRNPHMTRENEFNRGTKIMQDEQLNKYQRKTNDIQAFKILAVTDTGIVIRLPQVFGENRTTEFPLSDRIRSACEVGMYVDFSLEYTIYGGEAHSFKAKFWGITPSEFIPICVEEERS